MTDTMNFMAGHPDMLQINNSVQWEQSHCMWTDSMTDTMNFTAGHPDMLQINNSVQWEQSLCVDGQHDGHNEF